MYDICWDFLSYPDWTIPFPVHTYDSYEKLVTVIMNNNKPIEFFSIILSNPQCNHTMTENEIFALVEWLNQFRGILFGYDVRKKFIS